MGCDDCSAAFSGDLCDFVKHSVRCVGDVGDYSEVTAAFYDRITEAGQSLVGVPCPSDSAVTCPDRGEHSDPAAVKVIKP